MKAASSSLLSLATEPTPQRCWGYQYCCQCPVCLQRERRKRYGHRAPKRVP
jgi:hypothetical protein